MIEEKRPYYCYDPLHTVRLQLLKDKGWLVHGDDLFKISIVLKKNGFSKREDEFLFRLANHLRPQTILSVGSDFGLLPLYLSAYSKKVCCMVIEPQLSFARIAQQMIRKYASAKIEITHDLYVKDMPSDKRKIDMMVWGRGVDAFSVGAFKKIEPYLHAESVLVIPDIHTSRARRQTWNIICSAPKVTVTFDLCSLGVVFFNPKLHRKTYKNIV